MVDSQQQQQMRERGKERRMRKNGKKEGWAASGEQSDNPAPIHHPYTTAQNVASSEAEQSTHYRCLPPPPSNLSHATHGYAHRSYTLKTTRSTGGTGNYLCQGVPKQTTAEAGGCRLRTAQQDGLLQIKKRSRERATAMATVWMNGRTNERTNKRRKREGLLILGERVKGSVGLLC